MSSDVFSKDEKYRILSFTELKPIEIVGGKGTHVESLQPSNLIGGCA